MSAGRLRGIVVVRKFLSARFSQQTNRDLQWGAEDRVLAASWNLTRDVRPQPPAWHRNSR